MAPHYSIAYQAGSIDEETWLHVQPAPITHYLWEKETVAPYRPETSVQLCWTKDALHVRFVCYEQSPVISYSGANEPVYRDSCVEFFLQPMPETDPRYLNFEFNAAGTMLLGLGVDRNDRDNAFGLVPERFNILAERGLADEAGRIYWTLSFRIPLDWLAEVFPGFSAVPGYAFKGNFYKCGETPVQHYVSWSPVGVPKPDFHLSPYFGTFAFG
ncbi:carbohydrate-binding family 9-like protein [Cohnella rhizosphaerae]|uniref:Carbohydrate-binding family 9-like protein n=1 Tax=Cohnella rhizosphaerae TaxID=1457232 RepID=A0A9X4KYP5_9BACL|nr:carbohydrate-binding family 9-like protein [Cohnella rhizosphaerae]MDG0813799.1 carbohydrate-binding family 9-like protein [Cohnella rhizosphaerae]